MAFFVFSILSCEFTYIRLLKRIKSPDLTWNIKLVVVYFQMNKNVMSMGEEDTIHF